MSVANANSAGERPLRRGDVVEVKSPAEILSTLEEGDAVGSMPFMPEMLRHAGRRYTVSRRVDKICDTVSVAGSRRLHSTVFLDDLRCDGSAHGGCQAGCRLYWKEEWLHRVDADDDASEQPVEPSPTLQAIAEAGTRTTRDGESEEVWRCQATEALKASEQLRMFKNPGQYWREFTNGNFGRLRFIGLMIRAVAVEGAYQLGLLKSHPLHGPEPGSPPTEPLDLQPGELVQVRSAAEIEATLDDRGFNRGLSFDREMLPYCGQTLRVKDRVDRIIDEANGRMLRIPKDCIILEGSVCSGECSTGRWFCPREIYPFWREAWLRRVEDRANGATDSKAAAVPTRSAHGSPREVSYLPRINGRE
jgi:hypothetical protein